MGPVQHISQSMANMGLRSVAGKWHFGDVDTRRLDAWLGYSLTNICLGDKSNVVLGSFSKVGLGEDSFVEISDETKSNSYVLS